MQLSHINSVTDVTCPALQTGICGVGFSSVLSGQGSASADTTQGQIMLGMGLIVLSQVCAAGPQFCTIKQSLLHLALMQPWEMNAPTALMYVAGCTSSSSHC